MKKTIRKILTAATALALIYGRGLPLSENTSGNKSDTGAVQNQRGDETVDRLPHLLRDVKMLLTEALIADVHDDTLEVIYTLDRINDLLTEADQLGEMTEDDRDEFDRFENAYVEIYVQRFNTLDKADAALTAEKLRKDVTRFIEPLVVEMGATQFTVVDDRDGHVPLVRNKKVDQFIEFFRTKGRRQFEIWLERYDYYSPVLKDIITECGLPDDLIYLAMIESGLNPRAYSRANAAGMWQFIYSTGKMYGLQRSWYVDERRDPVKSTHAACAYIKDLFKEFDSWYLALAAYNVGSGRIHRAIRLHQTTDFWQLHSLPRETRNYIPYFLAASIIASDPQEYGFFRKEGNSEEYSYDEVKVTQSADLSVLARSAKISLKTLKKYNPELRQSATPTKVYTLKLPPGKKDIFLTNYNSLPENEKFAPQYIVHRVRPGESLTLISRKYRISIHDLAAVNKIRNRHKIRVGQKLTIPVPGNNLSSKPKPNEIPGSLKVLYTVKKYDTLGHIAENHGTRASRIRKWNGLRYGDYIYPGQKLIIWVKQS